jgi:titin
MQRNQRNNDNFASRRFSFVTNLARFAVAFVMFIVSFASGVVLTNAAGAAVSAPEATVAFLDLGGQITNSVVLQPQATANVLVRVANSGATATSSSSAPSLTISVPAGVSILSVDSINPGPSSSNTVTGTWTCSVVTATSKNCLLTDSSGQPLVLNALTQTLASIRLDSSGSGKITGAKIEATAQLAGATAVTTSASLDVESPQAGLVLNIIGQSQVQSGQATQITYQLTNRGLVTASSYTGSKGVVPAATLSNLLPARRFTSWTSSSTGWTCVGDPLEAPTCSMTDATLAPDASAPPLIIQFTLAQGRALTTPDASPSAAINWPVAIAEAANGGILTSTQNMELYVGPRTVGKLAVQLRAVTSSMLSPGQSVNFNVKHLAIDGFARGIVDTLTIPSGLTTSAVDSGGWKCPAGSGSVKCTFAGVVAKGGDPSYVITLNAASSAPSATGLLRVASSGNDGEATAQDAQPIFVINVGGARLEIKRILGSANATKVTDGKALPLKPGVPADASFVLVNSGNKPLAKGAVITVTASLSTAAIAYLKLIGSSAGVLSGLPDLDQFALLLPERQVGGPVCTLDSANYQATCILTLQAPLDVSQDSPVFSFLLKLKSAFDQRLVALLPAEMKTLLSDGNLLKLTASVSNNPDEIAPVTISPQISFVTLTNSLEPLITTPALKLSDDPTTVSFKVSNNGGAVGQSVITLPIPSSLRATAISGSACVVTGSQTQTVTCTVPAIAEGSKQNPTFSDAITFQLANVSATNAVSITASISVDGSTATAPVAIPIDPNPALTLVAPSNVQLSATGNAGELKVSFTASSNAPANQQYYAKFCLDAQMTTSCRTQNLSSGTIVAGLNAGTTYYVTITAPATGNYKAATSAPVSAQTASVVTTPPVVASVPAPGPVENLSSAVASPTSVTLTWTAPAQVGAGISGYTVSCTPSCTISSQPGASATSLTITGLTPGTLYTFTMVTKSTDNQVSSAATAPGATSSNPGAVSGLTQTSQTTTSVTLNWTAPTQVGAGISGYTVSCTPSCTINSQPGASATSIVITGLTSGTNYTFSVITLASDSNYSTAATVSGTTGYLTPGAVTGLNQAARTTTSVTLGWTAPTQVGAGIIGYIVSCTPSCTISSQPGASASSIVITGLTSGTSYTFGVITRASDGQNSSEATVSVTTLFSPPGSVTNLTATAGTGSVTLNWTAPTQVGSGITGYTVGYTDSSSGTGTKTVDGTTASFTGLSNLKTYVFTVVTNSSDGQNSSPTTSGGRRPNVFSPTTAATTSPLMTPALLSSSSTLTGSALQPRAATTTVPPSIGANFNKVCTDATAAVAANTTTLSENLGGNISASLTGVTVSGSCSGTATVSFTGGSLNLYGVYSVSIGSGTITSTGITISSASLTTPSGWSGGAITLGSTAPVTLPFSGTSSSSVSLQGTFSASGLFGLPLPSGWSATTSFSFSYTNSVVGIAVSSTGGPSGSGLTISGSANTSGDYSVSVSGNLSLGSATITGVSASWASGSPFTFSGTVAIGGTTLSVSGSYTNTTTWTFSANGSITLFGTSVAASGSIVSTSGTVSGSFTMTMGTVTVSTGMSVNSLTMSWSPSAGLSGAGSLSIGGTTLSLSGSYTDNSNWTFNANGSITLFGTTVTATGTVTKSSGSTTGSYTMTMNTVTVATGMSVNSLTMSWSPSAGLTGTGSLSIGGATLNLSGSYTDSNNWTFNATGNISLFNGTLSATGSVTKSSGTTSGTYTMTATGLEIVTGMTVNSLSMTWTPGQNQVINGTGVLSLGGTTLNLSGSYTSATNWTFNANGSVTLFGATVTATGTVTKTSSSTTGSYTMTMGTVTVVSGMTVNSLTMTWSPSTGLTGAGTLTIAGTAVNLTGSYTNSNNWSFTVSGNISLFGANIAATGTVTKSNGTTTGSYTMTVGNLSLVSGISATGLVMTWSTGNGLTGTGTIDFSDFAVAFSVQYTDSSNWTLNATSSGSGSIPIIPGVTISGASFTGTVTKVSGTVSLNLSVSFSSLTLIANLVSLQNATFSISNSCPTTFTSTLCPSGNTSYLSATGTLQMNLGTGLGTQNVAMSAVYGIQSKGFELSAGFSDITIVSGLLKVTSPTISLSYGRSKTVSTGTITGIGDGTKNGYTLSISGDVALSMPGFSQSISVKLTYGTNAVGGYNFVLNGDLVDVGTIGETGAAVADLVYSSAAMSLSLNGLQVTVPANTLVLGGKFVLPAWLAKYLGHTVESVALYATYTNPTSYSITGAFQLNLPIPTGSSSFKFSITSFSVSLAQSVLGYTQSLNATGTFTVSGSAGNAVIDITLGLSYQDSTETITGSITASASQGYLWSDAFGMPGVQLQAFAIQVGIELATSPIPLPSLGLAANLVINGTTAKVLGITQGTPIFALVNISATNPAMVIRIGVQGGPTAINIANVLTATYAELYLAPDGCTVGTYVIQPGFSFYFDGTILGVPLTVQAKITINGDNVNLDASVAVGAFNVTNSINFDGAVWTIAVDKDSAAFGFSGSGTIFGVTVLFSGETKYDLTTGKVLASYKGSVSDFNLYGFSLKNVSLTMDTVFDPQNKTASISISGTGSMTILGAELKIEQMVFSWQNGVFKTLAVQVSANIVVTNSISLVGDFFLNADLATQQFTLSATGKIVMGPFSLDIAACPNGQPGLSISTSGFNLCAATLDVGFARATISGVMYFAAPSAGTYIGNSAGSSVQAQAGDFNFGASNVTVDICGFASATGYLRLGNVGGTFFAQVSAGIGLSNTSSDQLVQISGAFDSAGNFTLTGTGQVKLAAINFNLNVTASSQGGQVSVSAGTNLSIAGSTFALTGTFAKVSGGVKITMSVMANLTISGFDLGQATVTVFVEPLTEYVSISSALSLGGIFNANLSGNLGAVNGQALFNFTVSTGINIPGVAVSGNLTLTNCGDSSCTSTGTFRASVSGQFLDFYGVSYSFSSVNVNSDWSFTSTSSGSVSTCSDWTSFGVVQFSACVGGSYSVTLSTASPYVAFNLGFDINVSRQIWTVTISCSGRWYNPRSWSCDVNAGWGPTRNFVSISGTVDSDGNVRASFNGITWRFKI